MFKISTNGALTSLRSFGGTDGDGANPNGLVQGRDGCFYGTTYNGGTNFVNGTGTVFKISANGVLTSLHSFAGIDGANPAAGLAEGTDGYFYGTTRYGGANDCGSVFKISTNGDLTSFYSFPNHYIANADGANPTAGLVQGNDGYFYGTTPVYGDPNFANAGAGTVFKISTNGVLTSLHYFASGGGDGAFPNGLVHGGDGYFYGTTEFGGTNDDGTVFKVSTNGDLTNLYSFAGVDGGNLKAGLVRGSDGYFYGTTWAGGIDSTYLPALPFLNGAGTVFKISTNGDLISLYSFPNDFYTNSTDGANPVAGLVQGGDGNLHGTTKYGGTNVFLGGPGVTAGFYSLGTVFKISTNGVLTSLHSFAGTDGANPVAGLVQSTNGNFYGTTDSDGLPGYPDNISTVFKISTNGVLTSYPFDVFSANPSGLVQGGDGDFYGTTEFGGTNNVGTVFKISASGELTTLYSFGSITNASGYALDGANPAAELVQASNGYFYGTTEYGGPYGFDDGAAIGAGTVFKISAGSELTTLNAFTGGNDGAFPVAALVQGSDGYFYGTTEYSLGTVFKISAAGELTTLYAFTGGNDGGNPNGLVHGSDGYFYGTTYDGGIGDWPYGAGTAFKISTNGMLISLYSFTGADDGANPAAGLVQAANGNFYDTTEYGGQGAAGTVFRLTVSEPSPEFQAVTLTNNTLSLTWSTEAGGSYQLQYSFNLSSVNWINLGSAVTAAGATLSATDSLTTVPQRFYRLVLLPQ